MEYSGKSMEITIVQKGERFICLVDDGLYPYLSQFTWSCRRKGYACRRRRKKEGEGVNFIRMHREVLRLNGIDIPKGMVVDHINRNRLDNRLKNLRVVTNLVNANNISQETREQKKLTGRINIKKAHLLPKTEKQRIAFEQMKQDRKNKFAEKTLVGRIKKYFIKKPRQEIAIRELSEQFLDAKRTVLVAIVYRLKKEGFINFTERGVYQYQGESK